MKRLKNIQGNNKEQLDEIKHQGERQLDAIEKQKENKLKTTEKYKKIYVRDEIDELFEMYPNSFDKKSKSLLNTIDKNESSINYKSLSYKTLLLNGVFHEFNCFKKYGTLYSLLKDLGTRKMIINSANADQISFIIDLMDEYDESKLTDIETIKNEFLYNTILTKGKKVVLDTKKKLKRR